MKKELPTWQLNEVIEFKTTLLQEWEKQPKHVQDKNWDYIVELTRRVRQLRVYRDHRKDSYL